eukprot:CAMPEP_0194094056 /NCGR_PEP_ID=MMETSP0149-20130528/52511_1 /TAXON_ID=122233 /ORGANISM="Chaetoceros debilis, Strain MM31A-1" /LENGTH=72 /DNA_ID=CAMNT_0038779571 /DNA_START=24 /DNA_END=239 /DNA_ORIENTATION=-
MWSIRTSTIRIARSGGTTRDDAAVGCGSLVVVTANTCSMVMSSSSYHPSGTGHDLREGCAPSRPTSTSTSTS